jgi:hypothetical protein
VVGRCNQHSQKEEEKVIAFKEITEHRKSALPFDRDYLGVHRTAAIAHQWGVVAEIVPNGKAPSRARELAGRCLKAPEITGRNTRVHFIQPLKERIVREVGYGLSAEGAS